jgi:CheY-like chemotaxis protein
MSTVQPKNPLPKFNSRLLIAEDRPDNSYILKMMLEKLGCNVISLASDGEDTVKKAEENKGLYDIIFMDCQMPIMDGYTATRIIKDKPWGKDIPIIAVTGDAFHDNKEKCIAAGMTDFITKPIRFSDLERILSKYEK